MLIVILSTLILGVSARDIDFQDYNIISIYQKFNPAILDSYMTPDDGYGAPLVTLNSSMPSGVLTLNPDMRISLTTPIVYRNK